MRQRRLSKFFVFRLVLAIVLLVSARLSPAQGKSQVWVNLKSGVYHCPETKYYGKTVRGEYIDEATAIEHGYRANGGIRCSVAVSSSTPSATKTGVVTFVAGEPALPRDVDQTCVLQRIVDADTIDCQRVGRVRLIGIDAPERSQRPFGPMAEKALAVKLPIASKLDLEFDSGARDRYGRILAYVWFEGHMVNWWLVRNGWAESVRYPPDVRHTASLDSAESVAKAEGQGLWRIKGFTCRPSERRRHRC